jgi:hypothetical protein
MTVGVYQRLNGQTQAASCIHYALFVSSRVDYQSLVGGFAPQDITKYFHETYFDLLYNHRL